MDRLPGFVTIPRSVELPRPSGAFFSAVVGTKVGPDTWKMTLDGRSIVVTSTLPLSPGQTLRLQLVSQQGLRWIFQPWSPETSVRASAPPMETTALMAAFVGQGLPLASTRLSEWTRWMNNTKGPFDHETWAASLHARGAEPPSPLTQALEPWLAWQRALEEGRPEPPPDSDEFWELWNSRQTASRNPWLAMPLRWEYQGTQDSGLLQAHWNAGAAAIDRWNLTACPAGIPFRMDATSAPGTLHLVWSFFQEHDLAAFHSWAEAHGPHLSSSDLSVTLEVRGRPVQPPRQTWKHVDVQA